VATWDTALDSFATYVDRHGADGQKTQTEGRRR
jgi:hypothetical protein